MAKLDKFISDMKEGFMVSLYKNRIMFYNEGAGEIQFWNVREKDENTLVIFNSGIEVHFDNYEIKKNENGKYAYLSVFSNDKLVAYFNFPSEKRIAQNHNTFYVSEFCDKMIETLQNSTEFKGDWTSKEIKDILEGLKNNASKLKSTQSTDVIKKSAIDVANYAMMSYYLLEGKN